MRIICPGERKGRAVKGGQGTQNAWRAGERRHGGCEERGVKTFPTDLKPDHLSGQPTDWLSLVRDNAAVCGDDAGDLGRAIVRIATLAAAAHRTALLGDASTAATTVSGAAQ